MAVSVAGIIINLLMVAIIITIIVIGVNLQHDLTACETKQSPFCFTIQCPCDGGSNNPPCSGFAKMSTGTSGQWNCSNAPLITVDNSGNPV